MPSRSVPFRVRLDLTGKATDPEGIDWNPRSPFVYYLSERVADAGAELKSVPAESVGVQQIFRCLAPTHHGEQVGEITLDARPHTDRLCTAKQRHDPPW